MSAIQPLLSVRNMTHTWDGVHGCRDIDFDLFPGEVLCVVGESGSGKSTLLQAVSYQVAPKLGSVWYDTRDAGFTDLAECARRLADASERRGQYRRTFDGDRRPALRRPARRGR